MTKKNLRKKLDYDEKSLKEKIKEKSGLVGYIGLGTMGFLHALSHVVPAIGALGMATANHEEEIRVFGYNIAPVLTSTPMEVGYLAFVPLSFYFIYRDHRHHKHEKEIRKENERLKKELEKYNLD